MKPVSHSVLALFALLAAGCDAGSEEFRDPTGRPVAIDWSAVRQSITGFGASSAWTAPRLSDSLAEQFFSVDNGIGLSIVRLRIAPDGTTAETETARLAHSYGAKVWAAPWSPPAEWKLPPDDGSMTEETWRLPQNGGGLWGGRLDPENYGVWAERLVTFAQTLEAEGVPLYALSAQNEPDYQAKWETCLWTPTELQTFIRDHLAPGVEEAGLDAHLIAPEASGWGSFARYADALMGDAATRDVVSVFATHGYNGTAYEYSPSKDHGKELWMTEVSDSEGSDPGINSALGYARRLHSDLTVGEVNAWHYWWLVPRTDVNGGGSNSALVHQGELTRRAHVIGQYARFLRPGAVRLEPSSDVPWRNVTVSAFRSAGDSELVIVAINTNSAEATITLEVSGTTVSSFVPWVTDETRALEEQPSFEAGPSFRYTLAPRSVTTLVGAAE